MIQKKLMEIQKALNVPKGNYNAFGKYKYRSCEDILEAVKPILQKNKTTLILSDSIEYIGDRHYIKATATLYDLEKDENITATAYAREELTKKGMDASQITGCASSYARKYALNGLFCIDDVKDADTMDNRKETATLKQVEYLEKVYTGDNMKKLLKAQGINSINEISRDVANELISKIKGGNSNE